MKIYLAGPDVFMPDAIEIGRKKAALCAHYGAVGLFPLDADLGPNATAAAILTADTGMMDDADAIIANLTPFRGPSADAGTVFELGYMAARKKLCFGYSNDPRPYGERARAWKNQTHATALGEPADIAVEEFGLCDNLMIAQTLIAAGHPMVVPVAAPTDIWRDLSGFETCVRLAVGAP